MSPNAQINRWRLRLSEYTYEIRHKPGKDHKVAEALSRLPTEGLDLTPLDEDIPVLAVETRASDALEAASPAEAPLGAVKRKVSGWMRCFTRDRSEARGHRPLTPLVCPSLNVLEAHPRQRTDRAHKSRRSSRSPRESPRAQLQKELPSRYKYK